jgi:hypothetical protein
VIPTEFVGAWERRLLELNGMTAESPEAVIWVQGRSAFADLRTPVHDLTAVVTCFAGFTTWEPDRLHWCHEIDLADPGPGADVGEVSWCGDELVERGTFWIDGRPAPYVEIWRRLPGSDGHVDEHRDASRVGVTTGRHQLTVVDRRRDGGEFRAEYVRDGEVVRRVVVPPAGGAT